MRLSTKTTERWPPDWNGNLELPENERMYVTVEFPDCETRASLKTIESRVVFQKNAKKEEEQSEREVIVKTTFDQKRILRGHVPLIEGFEDVVDGRERTITTGALLWKCRNPKVRKLVELIVAKVMGDEIPEDQEKNSEPPSTS